MKRYIGYIIIAMLFGGHYDAKAQSIKVEDKTYHWEGGVTAGLNSDGFELDFNIAYFVNRFVGLKAGIGMAGEIASIGDDPDEYTKNYDSRFKLIMSLPLRTPKIIDWKSQGVELYLFAEPGFSLSPGDHKSEGAKVFNWNLRSGINMQIDRWIFSLGYGISNFNLYSGIKPINSVSKIDKDCITHTVFIGCAYKF